MPERSYEVNIIYIIRSYALHLVGHTSSGNPSLDGFHVRSQYRVHSCLIARASGSKPR